MIEITLGANIKRIRESLNMTQPDLSKKSGVGIQSILMIEKGKAWPRLSNLKAIAKALGISKESLFSHPITGAQSVQDAAVAFTDTLREKDELITELKERLRKLDDSALDAARLIQELQSDNDQLQSQLELVTKELAAKNQGKVVANHIHDKNVESQYHNDDINPDLLAAEAALREFPEIVKDVLASVAVKRSKRALNKKETS